MRDPDPQMVAAWRREFRDCSEVQITCGKTLEDDKWDAVMMPMTNSFGWTDVEPVSLIYPELNQYKSILRKNLLWTQQKLTGIRYKLKFNSNITESYLSASLYSYQECVRNYMYYLLLELECLYKLILGKKDRQKNCKFVIAAPIMRVPIMISQTVNPYLAMRSTIQTIRRYNMTTREAQR